MLPGLTVRVVDSYIAGVGLLHATVQGLFTMAYLRGDGEIARGEFARWFAEAAWYPTALLPSQGVRWEAVDAHCANATMVNGPLSRTLLFKFNDEGLICSFRAEARGSMVGNVMVMAPCEDNWSNYQTRDGMQRKSLDAAASVRAQHDQVRRSSRDVGDDHFVHGALEPIVEHGVDLDARGADSRLGQRENPDTFRAQLLHPIPECLA